jgi:hypothetical protein
MSPSQRLGDWRSTGASRSLVQTATLQTFTVATNDYRSAWNERTEYHACLAWYRLAEICGQVLTKGQALRTRVISIPSQRRFPVPGQWAVLLTRRWAPSPRMSDSSSPVSPPCRGPAIREAPASAKSPSAPAVEPYSQLLPNRRYASLGLGLTASRVGRSGAAMGVARTQPPLGARVQRITALKGPRGIASPVGPLLMACSLDGDPSSYGSSAPALWNVAVPSSYRPHAVATRRRRAAGRRPGRAMPAFLLGSYSRPGAPATQAAPA